MTNDTERKHEQEIANPHDKLFKQILGEPDNAASFLAGNLPAGLVKHFDLSTVQVLSASFIDAQFKQSEADLLFSLSIAGRAGYVYCLLEHQSSPDKMMPLRLLGYMVRVWKRDRQLNPRADTLPVIVPMVLFHGPRGWRGPLDFPGLVDVPDGDFRQFVPSFCFRLFDLSPHGGEELAGNQLVRSLGDLFAAHGRPDRQEGIRKAFARFNEQRTIEFTRYFEILFTYTMQVIDIENEEMLYWLIKDARGREVAMTLYDRLKQEGEQQGLKKGRQEGRQEGMALLLGNQIATRFLVDTTNLLPTLQGLTQEQQLELSSKILKAGSLEEIQSWLNSRSSN